MILFLCMVQTPSPPPPPPPPQRTNSYRHLTWSWSLPGLYLSRLPRHIGSNLGYCNISTVNTLCSLKSLAVSNPKNSERVLFYLSWGGSRGLFALWKLQLSKQYMQSFLPLLTNCCFYYFHIWDGIPISH